MSTKAEQDTLRLLIQHVLRAFYEPKFSIVIDQLSRHKMYFDDVAAWRNADHLIRLKDEDLASKVGMNSKELNKVMAVMQNDGIIETSASSDSEPSIPSSDMAWGITVISKMNFGKGRNVLC